MIAIFVMLFLCLLLLAILCACVVGYIFIIKKAIESKDGYTPMVCHVLLLIFGAAFWPYIWNYRVTRTSNNVPGEEDRNPVTKLLLCLFVPFYNIYWVYKSAKRIDKKAAYVGVSSNLSIVCLILAIFIPVVAYIIMQAKINEICKVGTMNR